ncbi:sulfite exporter TauE/SafE family protein [Nodularia sp. UHCC 0506]|uniref:sulfite exporter TauE/SafE family protein n=1 Tax=Nodularia sp. UHCC 0506 TaxID=3110243 RepID=UPI002B1EBA39|nr:sulfite exporter TauE/SafE family protein [Nodularia sp. UHCC 0506]MEA5517211.1 sulfite exporter TauE/SafE family protein [Nodularia sp. UHCC 0506]
MKEHNSSPPINRFQLSFLYSVPIGILGGLIGLGGAEFRLPVLASILGYSAQQAVPVNLAVSLISIAASLAIRGSLLSFDLVIPLLPVILSLISGAVITAFFGATMASRLSNEQLERIILWLLVIIGIALIIEAFLPQEIPALLPASWNIPAGILFGLAIGLVSSLLGVAGGEVIIPTLVFAFGVDIRTAGTASLLISFPTVLVGVIKYASRGAFRDRTILKNTVAPMGVGSIMGAIIGGMLVGIIPVPILKIILGVILNISAFRVFHKAKSHIA